MSRPSTVYFSTKMIFVKVPKTATNSLKQLCDAVAGLKTSRHVYKAESRNYHETILHIKDNLSSNHPDYTLDDFFKFGFVRNPFSWAVSYYRYLSKPVYIGGSRLNKNENAATKGLPFKDFCLDARERNAKLKHPSKHLYQSKDTFMPQHYYLCDEDKNICVDFVGKYESLEESWMTVSERYNIKSRIPKLNASDKYNYKDYYNDETADLIREIYCDDFKLFNYSLDL